MKINIMTLIVYLVLFETIFEIRISGLFYAKGLFGFLFGAVHRNCLCKCGTSNAHGGLRHGRMLGGETTAPHEYPWMALIYVKDRFIIPGTLISDRHVITAASRMIGLIPYEVKVSLGVFDTCIPSVTSLNVSVSAISLHPMFDVSSRANDIALLRMAHPTALGRNVSPVCLPDPGTNHVGHVAIVAAWFEALVDADAVSSCRPRKAGLPILSGEECSKTALDSSVVTPDKNCLGIIGAKSTICRGDSGMPVMSRTFSGTYELIGVMTDGGECDTQAAALFTRTSDQLTWILGQMTIDTCLCLKF